ncbi:MAG: 50S ribosomal protein L11 methyltransferase [Gemmatimonadota bacterium]
MSALPGRWLELALARPHPSHAHLYGEGLRLVGARGMRVEAGRLLAVFPSPDNPSEVVEAAVAAIRSFAGSAPEVLGWAWRSLDEQRAIWRAPMRVWRISEGIEVVPAGTGDMPRTGRDVAPVADAIRGSGVTIRIRPGPAFGAADHPTTRGCLRLLERTLRPGERVADLGAGSGILSIASVLLGASGVRAFEADPLACAAAAENFLENRVRDQVELLHERVSPGTPGRLGSPSGVLANLETGLVLSLLPHLRDTMPEEGWLIVSGIPGGERAAVRERVDALGLGVQADDEEEGWWSAVLRPRPRPTVSFSPRAER